jgi:signal peptidase
MDADDQPRPAAPRRAGAHRAPTPRGHRVRGVLEGLLVLLLAGCVAAAALGLLLGYRPQAVRSSSMHPALRTGDLALTRLVAPAALRPGDVVTFRDPSQQSRLLTHRVVRVEPDGGAVAVETRGDVALAPERWRIARTGRVGRAVAVVPALGRLLIHWRPVLAGLGAAVALAAGTAAVRRLRRNRRLRPPTDPLPDAPTASATPAAVPAAAAPAAPAGSRR